MKKSNSRAEEVLNAASFLFSRKGYNATSLQDVADKVGLHKTSLFHYFRNKEEILMEIMDRSLKAYMNIWDDSIMNSNMPTEERLRAALKRQLEFICEYKDYINVYLNEIKSLSPKNRTTYNQKRRQYSTYFEKIIREIQTDKKSNLFSTLDSKVVTFAILGMCNWMINWYRKEGDLKPKEISEIFFSIIIGKPKK